MPEPISALRLVPCALSPGEAYASVTKDATQHRSWAFYEIIDFSTFRSHLCKGIVDGAGDVSIQHQAPRDNPYAVEFNVCSTFALEENLP